MKILLDECLPKKLKWELSQYNVVTVPEMGWAGVKNGELLRLMLEALPVEMRKLDNLKVLDISVNPITKIPLQINNMPNLTIVQ